MSGGGLAVEGLSLRLGAFALHDIALQIGDGEVLGLLGPNGAGKSVTVETIAGFHRPASGRIAIGECDVTALPPEGRQIGLMPQNYGLFPHLTVAGNVALPMRAGAGRRGGPSLAEVGALLARFGVAHLAGRRPGQLSPGERQRAALARSLAGRPRLFLFDEPFAALDARTREALRDELRGFLREAGIPAVFVTHDVGEAMALADRLAVLRDGRILQQGAAEAVYRAPADLFTARFLGVENILSGRMLGRDGAGCRIAVGDIGLQAAAAAPQISPAVSLAIRAEDVALLAAGAEAAAAAINYLPATVRAVTQLGALVSVSLDCGFALTARLMPREVRQLGLTPGLPVVVQIPAEAILLLK